MRKSAWEKAKELYIEEILENIGDRPVTLENALNGAKDWSHYSWSGCSLAYDADIAKRVCSPSEYKKVGHRQGPNGREKWLDTQARCLYQAWLAVKRADNA